MTAIAYDVQRKILAVDSHLCCGETERFVGYREKGTIIHKRYLYAGCGNSMEIHQAAQQLTKFLENNDIETGRQLYVPIISDSHSGTAAILLDAKKELAYELINGVLIPCDHEDFFCLGAFNFLNGCMAAGKNATQAVALASKHHPGMVGGKINVYQMRKNEIYKFSSDEIRTELEW